MGEEQFQLEQLLNEVQTISESYDRVSEATGENFNIFSILQMETNENATHSRFIAELLNPKGCHNQKDIFLQKFLELFGIIDFTSENSFVKTEYSIGQITPDGLSGGRIDIYIEDKNKKIIMIENKVYAFEQEKQLFRYTNKFPNGTLFYLTLYGEDSKDHFSKGINYQSISYEKHIVNWLEECRKMAVSIPILRESISQYINLIKKLTNQNLNKKMSQSIVTRILRDENSFKSFKTMVNSKSEIFKSILDLTIFPLLKELGHEKGLDLLIDKEAWLKKSKQYLDFSFINERLRNLNIEICFSCQSPNSYSKLIYGFKYHNFEQKKSFDYNTIINKFKEKFEYSLEATDAWPCFNNYNSYFDWESIDTWQKILFGDFKKDISDKIQNMLDVIENV